MTIQTINLGNYANDGTGDDLRTAFEKVNSNFTELNVDITVAGGENTGPTSGNVGGLYKDKDGINLRFKSLTSTDDSVTLVTHDDTVDLQANTVVETDTAPKLGGTLLLNGHIIDGANGSGDVQSTVHGYDIRIINSLLAIAFSSQAFGIDLGGVLTPAGGGVRGYVIDFGTLMNPVNNSYDFGAF